MQVSRLRSDGVQMRSQNCNLQGVGEEIAEVHVLFLGRVVESTGESEGAMRNKRRVRWRYVRVKECLQLTCGGLRWFGRSLFVKYPIRSYGTEEPQLGIMLRHPPQSLFSLISSTLCHHQSTVYSSSTCRNHSSSPPLILLGRLKRSPSLLPRNDARQGSLRRLTGTSTCICFQRRRVVYGTRYYKSQRSRVERALEDFDNIHAISQ
jgi:hypothetical protein